MHLLLFLACADRAPAVPPEATTSSGSNGAQTAGAAVSSTPARLGPLPAPARLVAVGDLHGDLDASLAVLRLAGVVDDAGRWSGGEAWLVQTGDITDRGPESRGVIALLRRLEAEAAAAGGRVLALVGNHEAMNLTGDWRYVSPEDVAVYGGLEARKAAYAPGGDDGAWLLAHDPVAQVGDTVFVHGGVDARWAGFGVRGLNEAVHAALLGAGPADVLGPDGPLWNRSYLLSDEATACAQAGKALAALGATRMVMGHTTQESGRIASRCEGRLRGIDTGISAHYGRHLAALEIAGGVVREIYPE